MAGRPLRNAMIDVLRTRTAEWFGDDLHTPLDYAVEWIENGRTIQHLIYEVSRTIEQQAEQFGLPKPTPVLSRTMLTHYLESLGPGNEAVSHKLSRARTIGAHAMVEQGNVALDATDAKQLDRDTLNVLDRRLAAKERLAAVWNRGEFAKTAQVQVALNVADLHLAALQAPPPLRVSAVVAGDADETDVQDGNEADWKIEQD